MAEMVKELAKWIKVARLSPRYAHEARIKMGMYARLAAQIAADEQKEIVCWWAS